LAAAAREENFLRRAVIQQDGKRHYVTTDKDSEFHRLAYVISSTQRAQFLTIDIPWDVEGFDLSRDGKRIAFVTNEAGSAFCANSIRRKRARAQIGNSHGVIGAIRWNGKWARPRIR